MEKLEREVSNEETQSASDAVRRITSADFSFQLVLLESIKRLKRRSLIFCVKFLKRIKKEIQNLEYLLSLEFLIPEKIM